MRDRKRYVNTLASWVGRNEADGSHKFIIDIYNANKPRPRGYKVKYTDSWCAATVSAAAIQIGYTDIIPVECSCGQMINLAKNKGIWVENDAYVPAAGDIIMYDWQDSGKGDNTGWPDHVGVIETVNITNNTVVVIEGNLNNRVGRRTIAINGKNIRGYIVPKFDAETIPAPAPVPTINYYPKYNGTSGSIADALKSLGIDGSYSYRKKIAKANGISGYIGTAKQNTKMLGLLKEGKLIKA